LLLAIVTFRKGRRLAIGEWGVGGGHDVDGLNFAHMDNDIRFE
jgi:hypothetical protein